MKKYITIYQIDNGYLAQEHTADGDVFRAVYLKDVDLDRLVNMHEDHEAMLRSLVMSMPDNGKITAIKAVREYIRTHKLDRSDGLKDVKDYVESIRPWNVLVDRRY